MDAELPIEAPAAGLRGVGLTWWKILSETINAYIDDDVLGRGAAIAFYSVIALAPVLIIVIWIAGLVFGEATARDAIVWQFQTLMGPASSKLLLAILESASHRATGWAASVVGLTTLVIAASGVFGEMQSAFNLIWKAKLRGTILSRLVKARAASFGLVAALGFFLLISLALTAGLTELGNYVSVNLPVGKPILLGLNFLTSFVLLSLLFAALYRVLPDVDLQWKDVLVGGVATSALFALGKFLIGFYLGRTAVASSFGAAGALVVILLWVYYTAQLLLLGAEFTKIYAKYYGSAHGATAAIKAEK